MESGGLIQTGARPVLPSAWRWKIGSIMLGIAILAPPLALSRYPFAFGMVAWVGAIGGYLTLCVRWRRYDLVAWLLIFYPILPLSVLYLHWSLAIRRVVGRHSPLFDGLIGLSDVGGFLGLMAYVGCVSLVAGAGSRRVREFPGLRRAAWLVVVLMPIAWIGLFAFTIWDPLGMLGYFFR